METIILLIGLIFFLAVGYFSFTFGQCVAKFSRLDSLIHPKIFGTSFLALFIYYVYSNQVEIIEVLMASLK